MNKNLNEEVKRIKEMMNSIIKEDFEVSKPMDNSDQIIDCESTILDSDTMEIVVMYDEDDKYETYLVSVEFEYEEGEDQTYDHPGYGGGAYGSVDGVKMTYPEEKVLSPEEATQLLSNEHVERCVSSAMETMENEAYEGRDWGPDPDDAYDNWRDD